MPNTIYSNDNFRRSALLTLDIFTENMRESEHLLILGIENHLTGQTELYERLEELDEIQNETNHEYNQYNRGDTNLDDAMCKQLIAKSRVVQNEINELIDRIWKKNITVKTLNIKPGDHIQMIDFAAPVRDFIVVETEVIEGKLNALLYDMNGDPQFYMKNIQWWYLYENYHREWRVKKSKPTKTYWEPVMYPKETK